MKKRKVKFLTKKRHQKGLPKLKEILGTYEVGSQVVVRPISYGIKNAPQRRYFSKVGKVISVRNKNHVVEIKNRASRVRINTVYANLKLIKTVEE